jgi:hypothetical protein
MRSMAEGARAHGNERICLDTALVTKIIDAESAQAFGQLQRHRHVEVFTGRCRLQKPFVVVGDQRPGLRHRLKRAGDRIGHLRIVLAEHDPVRLVGDEVADHRERVLRLVGGDKAVEQHVVGGKAAALPDTSMS